MATIDSANSAVYVVPSVTSGSFAALSKRETMKNPRSLLSMFSKRPSRLLRQKKWVLEFLEQRICLSLSSPALSSLPAANHTIYLDFDGHVTTGTTWNTGYYGEATINSPAWSLDSDRLNFSDTELATIQRIWQRVAEDFSPFNINVTTVEPSVNDLRRGEVSGDTKWGVRAVVTIETTTVRCGCGGIAYIGSFNDLYDEPVFVYNNSESGVAEAISHEVGHSLYLAHDGTKGADGVKGTSDDVEYYGGHGSGNTAWAPIMGSSYNRNVTTWDRGEYFNSNNNDASANYNRGADDLAIITSYNGFGYRSDDHGGTTATATTLIPSGTSISASGIVSSGADIDMFSFTTGTGTVSFSINPDALRPNLDIRADLLDALGNPVASSNPLDALNSSFSLSLAAGTYYLRIDGVGAGDPTLSTPTGYTDYSSIGQYSITGTLVDTGALPTLSVDDVSVAENDGVALFAVRLNGTITQNVIVSYTTGNGTAAAGDDYTATSGTLTFSPGGATSQIVSVTLRNDAVSEPTESFSLSLSNASSNALISDAVGTASISNDDAVISINDVSVTEGNVSRKGVITYTTATLTVSLAHPVNRSVAISYATGAVGDSATAAVDYQSISSGSLSIPAGQTSGAIAIIVIGDNLKELNETFSVVISSTDTVIDNIGIGTILDNDSGGGKSGGRTVANGVLAGSNYKGDSTLINHVDVSEFTLTGNVHADADHSENADHSDSKHHEGHSDDDFALDMSDTAIDETWRANSVSISSIPSVRLPAHSIFAGLNPRDFSKVRTGTEYEGRSALVFGLSRQTPWQPGRSSQLRAEAVLQRLLNESSDENRAIAGGDELFSNVGDIFYSLLDESLSSLRTETSRNDSAVEPSFAAQQSTVEVSAAESSGAELPVTV